MIRPSPMSAPFQTVAPVADKVGRHPRSVVLPPPTAGSACPLARRRARPYRRSRRSSGVSEEANMRVESSVTSVSWIPSEAVTGAVLKGTFDVRLHALRRSAARRHRRPRRAAGRRTRSASPTSSRPGSRSRTGRSSTPATPAAASWAPRPCAWPSCAATFEPVAAPRPPPRARAHRDRGRGSCRPPAVAPGSRRRGA